MIRVTNYRLEVIREEKQKREEIVKKQKTEAMAAKYHRARGGISLFSEKKGNYESETKDDTDPDQVSDKYPP